MSSAAISINNLSTFSASFADVSKKYIPCLCAKSSPTCVGISLSSRSILFPDVKEKIHSYKTVQLMIIRDCVFNLFTL